VRSWGRAPAAMSRTARFCMVRLHSGIRWARLDSILSAGISHNRSSRLTSSHVALSVSLVRVLSNPAYPCCGGKRLRAVVSARAKY
jgi:hypothetical protein